MSTDVDLGRDVEIARLEWEVCEAAVNLRMMNGPNTPAHAYVYASSDLMAAVDALIAARKKIEAEALHSNAPPS